MQQGIEDELSVNDRRRYVHKEKITYEGYFYWCVVLLVLWRLGIVESWLDLKDGQAKRKEAKGRNVHSCNPLNGTGRWKPFSPHLSSPHQTPMDARPQPKHTTIHQFFHLASSRARAPLRFFDVGGTSKQDCSSCQSPARWHPSDLF